VLHTFFYCAQWHCTESGGWPFQRLADQLCCDVLSPIWTVRHGAAAGLRELLGAQAAAAAVEAPLADVNTGWACAGNSGESLSGPCALVAQIGRAGAALDTSHRYWQPLQFGL
jgi:hypothetical protein